MRKNERIKIILLALVIIVLILCSLVLIRSVIRITKSMVQETLTERDPMFAEETAGITRPPELDAEETQAPHGTLDDSAPGE